MVEREILTAAVQQLEDAFSIGLANLRAWLVLLGLGAKT
jgi:hypothetical protein